MFFSDEIYTSDKRGDDAAGDGSKDKPFKTILRAMRKAGKEPFPTIYMDDKEDSMKYEVASKSQLKKYHKIWVREQYQADDKAKREEKNIEKHQQNLDDAKKIVITQDSSLPEAKLIKIVDGILKNILVIFF